MKIDEFMAVPKKDLENLKNELERTKKALAKAKEKLSNCFEDTHYNGCYPRHAKDIEEIAAIERGTNEI